ncbi:hypothetical protein CBR_g45939 [Chara braunii]|uniref:Uncharacterized protein n=1 Tax=Chara braunii TaxID=69332 RepID=A0A388LZM8_CHABU|nr:hypothetical protein CBR_g45939 [Chara braunii]|eukprot:GBG87784.1 hypothetical protein CBR_g45939 [Chara braunii]
MELVGELQYGDTLLDAEDDASYADDEDVANYSNYANIYAGCEDWEAESERSRDAAVWDRDELKGGVGGWWDSLMALSYQVTAESAITAGDTHPHQGQGDQAGVCEVEMGFMAAAAVVEQHQGMGEMDAKGKMDAINNNNNNNNNDIVKARREGAKQLIFVVWQRGGVG